MAAASKNLTAAGAVAAAGTVSGKPTELVAAVQVPPLTQLELTSEIEEAVDASEFEPAVKLVDVIVVFQPEPLPRASVIDRGKV